MTRKRLIDKILEELKDSSDEPGHYLVVYTGKPTRPHVYRLLEELFQTLNDGNRPIERNIIEANNLKTAHAVVVLLKHYGLVKITIYKIEEVLEWPLTGKSS